MFGKKSIKNQRRDKLFNKESDTIIRLQDKGNRFVIMDKNTDRPKGQQQIGRSFFIKLNRDLTNIHIKKFKEWVGK